MPRFPRPEGFRSKGAFFQDLATGVHDRSVPSTVGELNSKLGSTNQRIAELRNLFRGKGPAYRNSYEEAEMRNLLLYKQALLRNKRHKEKGNA